MNNGLITKKIIALLTLLLMAGCSSAPETSLNNVDKNSAKNKIVKKVVIKKNNLKSSPPIIKLAPSKISAPIKTGMFDGVYHSWKGTPYRFGGTSRKGIDCSAFVQVGFSSVHQLRLPRTTLELVKKGQKVARHKAQEGDLVFFRTGRNSRHVGIYLGDSEFLHASQSKGVIISRLDNPYWKRHFWQIRRIKTQ